MTRKFMNERIADSSSTMLTSCAGEIDLRFYMDKPGRALDKFP
jgi:hypothetical protein